MVPKVENSESKVVSGETTWADSAAEKQKSASITACSARP